MPSFNLKASFDEELIMSAGCISSQPGGSPSPNAIIVSVTFKDGTPCTDLTAKNFLVVSYSLSAHPAVIDISTQPSSFRELKDDLPGIDFKGVYRLYPPNEDQFNAPVVGQMVYVIKVNTKSPPTSIFETRYQGQTVVSVVMQTR